ncbi:MAG: SusF/SusE family outer membrane protein [Bacteroidales bacterium]|nr:SusF/SusE family outer membrane protein [Bacteroidales bacterium]
MVDGAQHNWDETILVSTPAVEEETNYTWTFANAEVSTLGSFKIREGQDWNGKSIGYGDVIMAGTAMADFEGNGDGNFVPLVDGFYDIVLFIDAVTETYTFTVNPAGVSFNVLYVPGAHQGWDPANESTVVYDGIGDGNYEGYLYFPDAANEFKFTNGPTWDENYGDDGADGTLDNGGANIVGGDAGYYKLNVDFNALTYTAVFTDWGLIGDATGSWDDDQNMTYDVDNDVWTITLDLIVGEFKFRANDAWDLNYGDEGGVLVHNGPNIAVAEDGSYTITMNLGTPPYSYTIVKN